MMRGRSGAFVADRPSALTPERTASDRQRLAEALHRLALEHKAQGGTLESFTTAASEQATRVFSSANDSLSSQGSTSMSPIVLTLCIMVLFVGIILIMTPLAHAANGMLLRDGPTRSPFPGAVKGAYTSLYHLDGCPHHTLLGCLDRSVLPRQPSSAPGTRTPTARCR